MMSWWDADENDISGDKPLDLMQAVLREHAEYCDKAATARPKLLNVLNALSIALSQSTPHIEDWHSPIVLQAEIASDDGSEHAKIISTIHQQSSIDTSELELAENFKKAIADMDTVYKENWQRKPRIREVLYALGYVLGYKPSRFLNAEETQNLQIADIFLLR